MKPFLSSYTELSEHLDDRTDFRADVGRLALLAFFGFVLTLGVHLLELPNWNAAIYRAGATEINEYADFGMAAPARPLAGFALGFALGV